MSGPAPNPGGRRTDSGTDSGDGTGVNTGVDIAAVLDEAWRLVQHAWDDGREVEYLMVPPEVLDAVAEAKARELALGASPRLLGLILVGSDQLTEGQLLVC